MAPTKQRASRLRPWRATALIAAAVYAASPLHRLAGGDSGELMAEACVGGVAHPPGYPLLLALLQLAHGITRKLELILHSKWLLGSDAESNGEEHAAFVLIANTLNAVLAVGAAACVTHVVDLWAKRTHPLEAVAAGLMFAMSPLTWEYAIGLEVFALNNLLTGALHVLALRLFLDPSARNAYAGAFVCGLGLANQHTIVLFEAPFIASVLLTRHFGVKEILCCGLWFVAGMSVYIHTFVSALEATPGSWGDASTLSGLWTHVLRREYGTFRLSPLEDAGSESLLERLQLYALDSVSEFSAVGIAVACVGLVQQATLALPRTVTLTDAPMQRFSRTLLAAMACYLLVFHALANIPLRDPLARAVSSRFAMQPNTVVAIWLGVGLVAVAKWLAAHVQSPRLVQGVRYGAVSVLLGYQLAAGAHNFQRPQARTSRVDVIRSYGETILQSLPPNALLLSYTDINWNTIRYLQLCERQRLDVTHLSLQLMPFRWFPRQHALYSRTRGSQSERDAAASVVFPAIARGVSTTRTSVGYTTFLLAFLHANLPQFHDRLFLDLHAVSDGDIRDGGRYHDVLLTPHGAVWQVHSMAAMHGLFERWERSSYAPSAAQPLDPRTQPLRRATPAMTETLEVAEGSWEFAAQTIVNDGAYQAALFRLGHWLSQAKRIDDVEMLCAFVSGMHRVVTALDAATQASEVVSTHARTSNDSSRYSRDATGAISYPAYDVKKNAAVARMRFQTGLQVLMSLQSNRNVRTSRNSRALDELAANVFPHAESLREQAIGAVRELLPAMLARGDEHSAVFSDFLDSHSSASRGADVATQRLETPTSAADAKGADATPKKRKRRAKMKHKTQQQQRKEATRARP